MSEKKITKETLIEAFKCGTDYLSMDPETQLSNASSELKNDREIMLAAVDYHGWLYEYASDELKSDKELALKALGQRKKNLEKYGRYTEWGDEEEEYTFLCKHFDKSLWKEAEIVRVTLELYGVYFIDNNLIHESLLKDKEFIISLFNIDWAGRWLGDECYYMAHPSVRKDKEIAMKLLDYGPATLGYFDEEILQEKEVVLKVLSENSYYRAVTDLNEMAPEMLKDKDVCQILVRDHHYENLIHIEPTLCNDKDIIQGAVSNYLAHHYQSLRKEITIVDRERMAYDIASNFHDELEFMEEDPVYWITKLVRDYLDKK